MADEVMNGKISAIADTYVPPEPAIDFEDSEEGASSDAPSNATPPALPKKKSTVAPQIVKADKEEAEPALEDGEDDPGDEDDTVEGGEAKAKPELKPKSEEPQYDPRLVARAREYDFTDEEITELSPAQLAKAVARQDRIYADNYRKQAQQAKAEKPEAEKPADPYALDIDESFFDDKKYDPEVSRAFKSIKEVNAKLAARLNAIDERETINQQTQTRKALDNWFNENGDPALVGEGSITQLKKDSAERFGRMKVVEEMGRIQEGYQAAGRTPPPLEEIARIAYVIAHGVAPEKVEEATRGRDLSEHKRRPDGTLLPLKPTATVRPSNRNVGVRTGEKVALAGIAQAIGIAGNHATATDAEVEEGLL